VSSNEVKDLITEKNGVISNILLTLMLGAMGWTAYNIDHIKSDVTIAKESIAYTRAKVEGLEHRLKLLESKSHATH